MVNYYLFFIRCHINGEPWINLITKHLITLYHFFSKTFLKILATRHIGNHFAGIGPIVTAREDPIMNNSHQGKGLYSSTPGRMIFQDNRMLRVERRSWICLCLFYQSGGSGLGCSQVHQSSLQASKQRWDLAAADPRRSSSNAATQMAKDRAWERSYHGNARMNPGENRLITSALYNRKDPDASCGLCENA